MATTTRKPGDFCWMNMITPQPDAARAFFGQLLGWTFDDMPGMGHSVLVDGHHIGGLFDRDAPQTPPGTKPVIGAMIKVDSADATADRVKALGGTVATVFDVGDAGRIAVCYDLDGANVDVWEPKASQGMDVDPNTHGAPSWFEIMSRDPERAAAFYTGLFGWTAEAMAMPDGAYTTFKLGNDYVAGLMQMPAELGDTPPAWGTYFTVRDADATAQEAVTLGAMLVVPPQDVPGVGRFCGIVSPQGVMFYAITYAS